MGAYLNEKKVKGVYLNGQIVYKEKAPTLMPIFKSVKLFLDSTIAGNATGSATLVLPAGTVLAKPTGELISIEDLTTQVFSVLKTTKTTIDKAEVIKILTDNGFNELYSLYKNTVYKFGTKADFDSNNKLVSSLVNTTLSVNKLVINNNLKILDNTGKDITGGALNQDASLAYYEGKSSVFKATSDTLPALYKDYGGPA